MSAVPILLADAVTEVINTAVAADYFETDGFTAERSYPDWDDDFEGLDKLTVDVVFVASASDGGDLMELDSAGSVDSEPEVDISIRKRFQPSDRSRPGAADGRVKKTAADPLVKLVEQIHEKMAEDRQEAIELVAGVDANWIDASIRTYCDYKRLREGNFLGVVRVRFNVSKSM